MCNHNINDINTTIIIDKKRFLGTNPRTYQGICKCCGQSFQYIKKDNKYIEYNK